MGIKLLIVLFWGISARVYAQGSAVLTPMSAFTVDPAATLTFHINNRAEDALKMKIQWKCDVDGKDLEGQACLDMFQVEFDSSTDIKDVLEIPVRGRVQVAVRLKGDKAKEQIKYAIFKPMFKPEVKKEAKENSIAFEFAYQPGMLFLVHPSDEKLTSVKFSTDVLLDARRAKFDFDLRSIKVPSVASISSKIYDVKTKKVMRFMRMASSKIIDPRRETLTLETEFAPKTEKADVCYQAFIENITSKSIYSISNCAWIEQSSR